MLVYQSVIHTVFFSDFWMMIIIDQLLAAWNYPQTQLNRGPFHI